MLKSFSEKSLFFTVCLLFTTGCAPEKSATVVNDKQAPKAILEEDSLKSNNEIENNADIKLAPLDEFADSKPDELQTSFSLISDNRPTQKPRIIQVNSLEVVKQLFDSLNYNSHSWQQGHREVPRLTFETVTEKWQHNSNHIPVAEKDDFLSLDGTADITQ